MEEPHRRADYQGHRQRLKQRFHRTGLKGFANYEVLEILLSYAIGRKDTKSIAKTLIRRFDSLAGVLNAPKEELLKIKGIGENSATLLLLLKNTTEYYLQEKAKESNSLDNVDALIQLFHARIAHLKIEVFEVAYLDHDYQLIGEVERLETGEPNRTYIYPRKIVAEALRHNASFITLAHNHPSGKLTASQEDKQLTKSITEALLSVNIQLLDHLILSPQGHFSFLREKLL